MFNNERNTNITERILEDAYAEKLTAAGITSRAKLLEAVRDNSLDLRIDTNALLSPEKKDEILKKNPDKLQVGDDTFDIEYGYDDYKKEYTAALRVSAKDIFRLDAVPNLPSGRPLQIALVDNFGSSLKGDLDELKDRAERILLAKLWTDALDNRTIPYPTNYTINDPRRITLSPPILYGKNPRTGEDLYAYPALTNGFYGSTLQYYRTAEEAKRINDASLEAFQRANRQYVPRTYRSTHVPSSVYDYEEPTPTITTLQAAMSKAKGESSDPVSSTPSKRENSAVDAYKLNKQIEETQAKLDNRKIALAEIAYNESILATNVTSGEVNEVISTKGKRLVAKFEQNSEGELVSQVIEWPSEKLVKLVLKDEKPGEYYVEIIEEEPDKKFHSDELGIDGTTFKVKIVDLTEADEEYKMQAAKLAKLKRRSENNE